MKMPDLSRVLVCMQPDRTSISAPGLKKPRAPCSWVPSPFALSPSLSLLAALRLLFTPLRNACRRQQEVLDQELSLLADHTLLVLVQALPDSVSLVLEHHPPVLLADLAYIHLVLLLLHRTLVFFEAGDSDGTFGQDSVHSDSSRAKETRSMRSRLERKEIGQNWNWTLLVDVAVYSGRYVKRLMQERGEKRLGRIEIGSGRSPGMLLLFSVLPLAKFGHCD